MKVERKTTKGGEKEEKNEWKVVTEIFELRKRKQNKNFKKRRQKWKSFCALL